MIWVAPATSLGAAVDWAIQNLGMMSGRPKVKLMNPYGHWGVYYQRKGD